jgi:hypothetical protein
MNRESPKYIINTVKLVNRITEHVEKLNTIEKATTNIRNAKTEYSARKWRHKRAGHLAHVARSL